MTQGTEEALINRLKANHQILCTVESCTGGLIAHSITNVSGSSEVFWGGFVTYDNSAKEGLGVQPKVIAQKGAVSAEVAQELAECGLKKMSASPSIKASFALLKPVELICVSITGIAGPSGGSSEKPVGLCYIGLARSGKLTQVEKFQVDSKLSRIQIKNEFTQRALKLMETLL